MRPLHPNPEPRDPRPDLKLLVYDLDGTLVDAFEDIWRAVNAVLGRFGLAELPFETVKSFVGEGAATLIRRCLGREHEGRFEEIYGAFRTYYTENPSRRAQLYPGVARTLDELRERGLRQAILTNKPHEITVPLCRRLGLAERVDGIWGERSDAPHKPDPEALLQIVRHFGLDPAQCAMVGDGQSDHQVARAAGAPMIAVTWGVLTAAQARSLRPLLVIDQMEELAAWFDHAAGGIR